MKITLGFSPCPNDTFIFDALVNKKIDTEDVEVEVHLEDVQTLNNLAQQGELDVSKISYGVLPLVLDKYVVLDSGGALGKGVGPLLISRKYFEGNLQKQIAELTAAIPGANTTAHMLFTLAFPEAANKKFMVFHEIEDAVLTGKADAGVIIHENRFTYEKKGLIKLVELGEYWEEKTGLPIPLGGIVAKRNIDKDVLLKVNNLIKKSVQYAFENYPFLSPFIHAHSQEMEEDVMRKHIDLYVNNYSLELGNEGRTAVMKLLEVAGCKATDVFVS